MPGSDVELPPAVTAFIDEQRVGRFASVDAQGRPHVVPICFVLLDGALYSVLDAKPKSVPVRRLRRVVNILANPEVQVLFDRYSDDWSRLAFVQLRGRAALLEPGDEQARALTALRARYPQYLGMRLDDAPMIKVSIEGYTAWPEATFL